MSKRNPIEAPSISQRSCASALPHWLKSLETDSMCGNSLDLSARGSSMSWGGIFGQGAQARRGEC